MGDGAGRNEIRAGACVLGDILQGDAALQLYLGPASDLADPFGSLMWRQVVE